MFYASAASNAEYVRLKNVGWLPIYVIVLQFNQDLRVLTVMNMKMVCLLPQQSCSSVRSEAKISSKTSKYWRHDQMWVY